MNVPGCARGNWRWRCTDEMLTDKPFAWLGDLTANTNRLADAETSMAGESIGQGSAQPLVTGD